MTTRPNLLAVRANSPTGSSSSAISAINIESATKPARTQIDMVIQIWPRDLLEDTIFPCAGEINPGYEQVKAGYGSMRAGPIAVSLAHLCLMAAPPLQQPFSTRIDFSRFSIVVLESRPELKLASH